jgi:hypothetical protein
MAFAGKVTSRRSWLTGRYIFTPPRKGGKPPVLETDKVSPTRTA